MYEEEKAPTLCRPKERMCAQGFEDLVKNTLIKKADDFRGLHTVIVKILQYSSEIIKMQGKFSKIRRIRNVKERNLINKGFLE